MRRLFLIGLLLLIASASAGCRASVPAIPAVPGDVSAGWTLVVRDEGPRWLGPDWWRAQGLDPTTFDSDAVHLQRGTETVPFLWLESSDGPGLLFYGTVAPTRLGLAGGYHLTLEAAGTSIPVDVVTVEPSPDAQTTTTATLWLERDNTYRPTAPPGVNWLWTSFNATPTITLTIPLTEALPVPVTLSLHLWGQSSMPQNPDHHIRVLWNGDVVDEHYWDGSALEVWSVTVPQPRTGDNVLALVSPGDTEAPVEVTWLDKVGVTWLRRLTYPGTGWETWTADTTPSACWDGAVQGPVAVILAGQDGAVRGTAGARFADEGRLCVAQRPGERGWIGGPEAAPPPDIVRAREIVTEAALLSADYLVIAPRLFHAALAPLIEAREADGLVVALVTPEQIYDTYGTGEPDAEAIRSAVLTLQAGGSLRYLLVVGDASANPAAVWAANSPVVPTGWVRTAFVGDTPSDHALVADDAGTPLVAVGRFPVSTVAEVEALVAKTLAWEPSSRLLLLNDDSAEFVQMADALAEIQTPGQRLDAGDANVRRDLLHWLRTGPGTLVYTGHGSLPLLGDEKFLTVEDAGTWDGPTVVVAWTCLCASFTHPQQSGLSEAWLRDAKGTVAFVGPTGETTTGDQAALAAAFHRALAEGATLGDALLVGWRAASSEDAEASFLLLGDPALRPAPEP